MLLFFAEFGIPAWFAFFFLVGLLICPVLSVMAIFYICRRDFRTSTIVVTLVTLLLLSACLFPLVNSETSNTTLRDISYYLFYLSYPFGFTSVMLLAAFQGINDWRLFDAVSGIIVNLLATFGMVRFIQKFIEKRRK
jgi:hypothetical protein